MRRKDVIGFQCVQSKEDGHAYKSKSMGLMVIQSENVEDDGNVWIHTSFSRRSRIPDYKDIQFVKKHFIGDDQKAIMVFPEKENHVNIHPYCLHLFSCDHAQLPDFTGGTGSI